MRISLDIQDQNLTPEAREILLGLLHRLEREPERFTERESPVRHLAASEGEVDVREFLVRARANRTTVKPITPGQFFSRVMATKGFESKEAAREHVQGLRSEWD